MAQYMDGQRLLFENMDVMILTHPWMRLMDVHDQRARSFMEDCYAPMVQSEDKQRMKKSNGPQLMRVGLM